MILNRLINGFYLLTVSDFEVVRKLTIPVAHSKSRKNIEMQIDLVKNRHSLKFSVSRFSRNLIIFAIMVLHSELMIFTFWTFVILFKKVFVKR